MAVHRLARANKFAHATRRGEIEKVARSKRSITGKYLRGDEEIEVPKQRRRVGKRKNTGGVRTRET